MSDAMTNEARVDVLMDRYEKDLNEDARGGYRESPTACLHRRIVEALDAKDARISALESQLAAERARAELGHTCAALLDLAAHRGFVGHGPTE